VSELRSMMQSRRIRHVPVCEESGLCGLVSIGDVNALEADGLSATIVAMEEYITRG
jgi:signal-transduction protein with cAMP-binding, CBS, and nucleotidyltransferase domain